MTISDDHFSFNASLHRANLAGAVKVSVFSVHCGGVVDDIRLNTEGHIGDTCAVHRSGSRHAVADMHTDRTSPSTLVGGAAVGTYPEVVVLVDGQVVHRVGCAAHRGDDIVRRIGVGVGGVSHSPLGGIAFPGEGCALEIGCSCKIGGLEAGGGSLVAESVLRQEVAYSVVCVCCRRGFNTIERITTPVGSGMVKVNQQITSVVNITIIEHNSHDSASPNKGARIDLCQNSGLV